MCKGWHNIYSGIYDYVFIKHKNNIILDIIAFLKNGVITTNELNVFSKSVREAIEYFIVK